MDTEACVKCGANFRSSVMQDGRCPVCIKQKDEEKKSKPIAETLTERRVKAIIYETLEEAGIKRKKCDKCGDLYFSNAPASKFCKECKDKK